MSLTLEIQDARWRKLRGISARLTKAVRAALHEAGADEAAALTLLLTTDKRVQALNLGFRGLDKPTNVLSFPAGERNPEKCEAVFRKIARPTQEPDYIGDIAIAYGVTAKEAKASNKTLLDHVTHLTVHGVLHLLGYDHVTPRKARVMEPMETRILASLNIADPYEEQ